MFKAVWTIRRAMKREERFELQLHKIMAVSTDLHGSERWIVRKNHEGYRISSWSSWIYARRSPT
jgi:hypothetical protein